MALLLEALIDDSKIMQKTQDEKSDCRQRIYCKYRKIYGCAWGTVVISSGRNSLTLICAVDVLILCIYITVNDKSKFT